MATNAFNQTMQSTECLICAIESTTKEILLPCSHEVCLSCATKLSGSTCPFCRGIVTNWPPKMELLAEGVLCDHATEILYNHPQENFLSEDSDESFRFEDSNDKPYSLSIALISTAVVVLLIIFLFALLHKFGYIT